MPDPQLVLGALRTSQQRLAGLIDRVGAGEFERPSYDQGWSVADVLSHLGSQAEIFTCFVDAGLQGTAPPSNDSFGPIWDRWNAKSPGDKVADSLSADAAFLDLWDTVSADQLNTFELDLFGMEVDAARLLGMRLGEHALHSWDVAVAFDDEALLAPDATELVLDALGALVPRVGRPESDPATVSVVASSPDRRFILDTAGVSLEPGDAPAGSPRIELSAEALVRLVYGRLDDRHPGVPEPTATGIDLDRLRAVFPGL